MQEKRERENRGNYGSRDRVMVAFLSLGIDVLLVGLSANPQFGGTLVEHFS